MRRYDMPTGGKNQYTGKTQCKRGHKLTKDNTRYFQSAVHEDRVVRECRTCSRMRKALYRKGKTVKDV